MTLTPAAPITEEAFAQQVLKLAQLYGWLAFRVENSSRIVARRSGARVRVRNVNRGGAGYPDLTLVRAPRLIFAELKRDVGPQGGTSHAELSADQLRWAEQLRLVSSAVESAAASMSDPRPDV
ncbi:MAG: hypothetical protein M3O91_06215, partial [Chloroflexota bacterium]|nr:hypothetical protein [Chloroflexota bacterium]